LFIFVGRCANAHTTAECQLNNNDNKIENKYTPPTPNNSERVEEVRQ